MTKLLAFFFLTTSLFAQQIQLQVSQEIAAETWQRLIIYDAILIRELRADIARLRLEVDQLRAAQVYVPVQIPWPEPDLREYNRTLAKQEQDSRENIERLLHAR